MIALLRLTLILLTAGLLALNLRRLTELVEEAANHFRGGPRAPRHPLPTDDSGILNRRRAKSRVES